MKDASVTWFDSTEDYLLIGTGINDNPSYWSIEELKTASWIAVLDINTFEIIKKFPIKWAAFDYCYHRRLEMIFSAHNRVILGLDLQGIVFLATKLIEPSILDQKRPGYLAKIHPSMLSRFG